MVGHQQDIAGRILAGDLIQPAVLCQKLMLCFFVQQGEVLCHHGAQLGKLGVVVGILDRYGGAAEHPGEGFTIGLQFFLGKGGMLTFQLSCLGCGKGGIDEQYCREDNDKR